MRFEHCWDPSGLLNDRHFAVTLFLSLLNPSLDVADCVEILCELQLVPRPERAFKPICLIRHEVKDAAILPKAGFSRSRVRAVSDAE